MFTQELLLVWPTRGSLELRNRKIGIDLRSAVPVQSQPQQFLDLEALHMSAAPGDTSGETDNGSDEDSHSSFIDDDTPSALTIADAAVVETMVLSGTMPLTVRRLRLAPTVPVTNSGRKRKRVMSSSSSSSSSSEAPPSPAEK